MNFYYFFIPRTDNEMIDEYNRITSHSLIQLEQKLKLVCIEMVRTIDLNIAAIEENEQRFRRLEERIDLITDLLDELLNEEDEDE